MTRLISVHLGIPNSSAGSCRRRPAPVLHSRAMRTLVWISLLFVTSPVAAAPGATVDSLSTRYLDGLFRAKPHLATFMGEHRYDGKLPDLLAARARGAREGAGRVAEGGLGASRPRRSMLEIDKQILQRRHRARAALPARDPRLGVGPAPRRLVPRTTTRARSSPGACPTSSTATSRPRPTDARA